METVESAVGKVWCICLASTLANLHIVRVFLLAVFQCNNVKLTVVYYSR